MSFKEPPTPSRVKIPEKAAESCERDVKKVKLLTMADVDRKCDNFDPLRRPMTTPKAWWSEMTLRDFEIGKPLGEGLFGHVYLARMKSNKIPVALKVIHSKEIEKAEQQHAIIRETEIHAGLDHEHIIRMHGYFRDEDKIVYVIEYAAGGEVYAKLKAQPTHRFSNEIAATYIYQVTLALEYLHSKCITHRDIKPENLLLGDYDQIKMADFGWSIQVKPSDGPYTRKTIVGTQDYLAPEMVERHFYDERVDIWCVGILMYEFLVGNPPFESQDASETEQKIRTGDFEIPDFIDEDAKDLIQKILVIKPTERLSLVEIKNHPWIQKNRRQKEELLPMFDEYAHLLPELEERYRFLPTGKTDAVPDFQQSPEGQNQNGGNFLSDTKISLDCTRFCPDSPEEESSPSASFSV